MKFKEIREKYKSKFPSSLVAAAVKIALDMGGAMTPAVKKIEAMKRGLSSDPAVKNALRLANEDVNEIKEEKFKLVDMDDKTAMNAQKLAKKAGLKAVVKKTSTGSDVMVVGDNKKMAKFLMSLPNEGVQHEDEDLKEKADDDTVAMIRANPKMKDKVLRSLNPKARKAVLKALGEQINEFKTSFPFFDLKTATAAEKLAMKMKIHSKSEKKGKLYTVHVDGKFTDIEKWVDAL